MNLIDFFTKELTPRQKQYEALRAVAFHEGTFEEIAARFGYTSQSLKILVNRLLRGRHTLFPVIKRGPKGRHISPEAAARGPIASLQNGDIICIDIPNNKLDVELSDADIKARLEQLPPFKSKATSGYLKRYSEKVSSASRGAVFVE